MADYHRRLIGRLRAAQELGQQRSPEAGNDAGLFGVQDSAIGDKEPLVRRLLPDPGLLIFSMWLIAHREVSTSRRIRVVFDLLAAERPQQ